MNEWMNEWCIYIALYCIVVHPKRFTIMCVWAGGGGGGGVSPQPPPVRIFSENQKYTELQVLCENRPTDS